MRGALSLLLVTLLTATACAGDGRGSAGATSTSASPTPTTAPATTTTVPPPTTAGPPQAGAADCPPVPERARPRGDRPRYTLDARLDLAENRVVGSARIAFTPDLATDRVVLRMWANGPRLARAGAHGELTTVTIDGRAEPTARPDPTMWESRPKAPLAAGRTVEVRTDFVLTLPGLANDRIARDGDMVRLGSWFPILPWEPGRGWATDPATAGFAEASTAPTADFDVSLDVPDGLTVVATGLLGPDGRWRAAEVRDWAATVGRFRVQRATESSGGRPVELTVAVAEGVGEDPAAYLERLRRILPELSRRFGPYPWPSYSLAITPGLRGGIEYPTHVMQGPGTVGRTTSHELAHMWFYGLVGNDQGRDPVLDEGLATWGEAVVEGSLARLQALAIPADARGRVGAPMTFWDSRLGSYYRGVYVQGAVAVGALGPAPLVDCALHLYVARNAYAIATPADLLEALEAVFPRAREVLAGYGLGS